MDKDDRKIISIKEGERDHQLRKSLKEGYYIDGKLETFIKTELFDRRVIVYLPKSFIDLPQHIREYNYPPSADPLIIKTNLDYDVNFTFQLMQNPSNLAARDLASEYRLVYGKLDSSKKLSEIYTEQGETGPELTLFAFHDYGADKANSQFVCFAAGEGIVLQITFNCPERSFSEWEKAVREVFRQLKIR